MKVNLGGSTLEREEMNVIDLLQYLQDLLESSARMPITGKNIIDKKEFNEVIEQIISYIPDQLKKAQWVMSEKERILSDAQKEYDSVKKETIELMREKVENHDVVKEAKIRASEIVALAQRDAKAIRLGARDYANDILVALDTEIEGKKVRLISDMQNSFESVAQEIDLKLNETGKTIRENIAELRNM